MYLSKKRWQQLERCILASTDASRGKEVREIEAEKTIYVGDCSVVMDYKKENATSILCQVMFDETVRLRKCANRKERENIRNFIKEAYSLFLEENSRSEC